MLIKLNEIIVEVPFLPPNKKNGPKDHKRSLAANRILKMPKFKMTNKLCLMLTKVNEIIAKITLPPPNKKNWALGPKKIFIDP